MESATNTFLTTIAIVAGILSPFILITLLDTIRKSMVALSIKLEAKTEELKKMPPFDDVELNLSKATKMLSGRIIKDGKVIWQGSISRNSKDIA